MFSGVISYVIDMLDCIAAMAVKDPGYLRCYSASLPSLRMFPKRRPEADLAS